MPRSFIIRRELLVSVELLLTYTLSSQAPLCIEGTKVEPVLVRFDPTLGY